MKKRVATALLIALMGSGSSFALAANDEPRGCAADKAHCDLDGDGIVNPDDDDVDGDGNPNATDPCPRDAADTCDDETGGEDPGTPGLPTLPELPLPEVPPSGEPGDPGDPGLPTLPDVPAPALPELPAPAVPELPAPPPELPGLPA